MQPDEMDAARLWDMLTYARGVERAMHGRKFEAYIADDNLRLAVERRLEIIGEAARNVSPAFRAAHSEIPWRRIIGLRNVLVPRDRISCTPFLSVIGHLPRSITHAGSYVTRY